MTPLEIAQVMLKNIEATRKALDNGEVGYVLQLENNRMRLICKKPKGPVEKGDPMSEDVLLYGSRASAEVAQRYWNSRYPDEPVRIALRREALTEYMALQDHGLNNLLDLMDVKDTFNKGAK